MHVLALAGIEWIYFSVAGAVLWCRRRIRVMLITLWCLVIAEKFLHHKGPFRFSHHPTSEETERAEESGRAYSPDRWPQLTKGIFHTMLWNKMGKLAGALWSAVWGLAGHWSVGGKQLHCASLVLHILIIIIIIMIIPPSFSVLENCLNPRVLPFFPYTPPCHWGEWANGCEVFSCLPGWTTTASSLMFQSGL